MPFLVFRRDVQCDHPVIDQLRRDLLTPRPSVFLVGKAGCSHGRFDIAVDLLDVGIGKAVVNVGVHVLRQRHAFYIVNGLLKRLFLLGEKRLAEFGLPF